jgi:hypothetical protein
MKRNEVKWTGILSVEHGVTGTFGTSYSSGKWMDRWMQADRRDGFCSRLITTLE